MKEREQDVPLFDMQLKVLIFAVLVCFLAAFPPSVMFIGDFDATYT